jgi:hypothetical protein
VNPAAQTLKLLHDQIRNATLRDVVAHLRQTPWYVVKEITDRDGRPWPLVKAKSANELAAEIEAMIEGDE